MLPSTGEISLNQIRTELGLTGEISFSNPKLKALAWNTEKQSSFSEFYGKQNNFTKSFSTGVPMVQQIPEGITKILGTVFLYSAQPIQTGATLTQAGEIGVSIFSNFYKKDVPDVATLSSITSPTTPVLQFEINPSAGVTGSLYLSLRDLIVAGTQKTQYHMSSLSVKLFCII